MGLDTVELILRCEETFAIDLPDADCGQVRTVEDLYRLICQRLGFFTPAAIPFDSGRTYRTTQILNLNQPLEPDDVWATLVALIADQLQVDVGDITPSARFLEDLGCD